MAVRFIIGRSGTGKTHHCVKAIVEALSQANNQPLVLLVPEQATYQASEAILKQLWHGLPARENTAKMAVLQIVPDGVDIYNPAFDVTPAQNITAIITERGVIEKPNGHRVKKHFTL